jgi:hypothetical protein
LCDELIEVLEDLGIADRLWVLLVTMPGNNTTLLAEMEMVYAQKYPQAGFTLLWNKIECTAHTLNLAAQSLLKNFKLPIESGSYKKEDESSDPMVTAVSRLSFLCRKIKASPKNRRLMETICVEKGMKFLVPVIDVITRWNSTYDMLLRAYTYRAIIDDVIYRTQDKTLIVLILSDEDWECVRQLIEILEPMKKVTLMVSKGGECLGITKVLGMYHYCTEALRKSMTKFKIDDDIYIGMETAREKLLHYYDNISPIVGVALILDPSKKESYLRHALSWKEEWIASVLSNFHSAFQYYKGNTPASPKKRTHEQAFNEFDIDDAWDTDLHTTGEEVVVEECIRYLNAPIYKGSILAYWKANQEVYPVLARMAKVLLLLTSGLFECSGFQRTYRTCFFFQL